MDFNEKDPEEFRLSKLVISDVFKKDTKIAEAHTFYDRNDKKVKEITYVDMHNNRRYDIPDSIAEFKNGVISRLLVLKVDQIVKYNTDGSVRNVTNLDISK